MAIIDNTILPNLEKKLKQIASEREKAISELKDKAKK